MPLSDRPVPAGQGARPARRERRAHLADRWARLPTAGWRRRSAPSRGSWSQRDKQPLRAGRTAARPLGGADPPPGRKLSVAAIRRPGGGRRGGRGADRHPRPEAEQPRAGAAAAPARTADGTGRRSAGGRGAGGAGGAARADGTRRGAAPGGIFASDRPDRNRARRSSAARWRTASLEHRTRSYAST